MDIRTKLFTLLAIFCLIVSAGVVCAEDIEDGAGCNYPNINGLCASPYHTNEMLNASADNDNQTVLEPESNSSLENQTVDVSASNTDNAISNTTGNDTGNSTNSTINETIVSKEVTDMHNKSVTGNPIVLLLSVSGILGGYNILRRKY